MPGKDKIPVSAAVRVLREHEIAFTPHLYRCEEKPRPADAAALLGIPPHVMVKTIVLEDEGGRALIVLQHVEREISTRALARTLGVRSTAPASPERAAAGGWRATPRLVMDRHGPDCPEPPRAGSADRWARLSPPPLQPRGAAP